MVLDEILNLLFPKRCLGCNTSHEWFCKQCQMASILAASLDFCQLCGRSVPEPGAVCDFHRATSGLDGLVSYADYRAEPIRAAIRLMKYEGVWAGLPVLSHLAWETRWRYLRGDIWSAVVPIPLHPSRLRERGYNQAAILANPIRAQLGLPNTPHLIRHRATPHQVGLRRSERLHNLDDAFLWTGPPLTGSVLLVDDVVTTGTTLSAAAAILRQHGAARVWACTLAYEPPM